MIIYIAIVLTLIFVTQIVRNVQNSIQLRRQLDLMQHQRELVKKQMETFDSIIRGEEETR